MSAHLSQEQLLTLIETPGQPVHAHLDGCDSCRQQVLALRAILRDVRAVNVPEPSPLFWDHLARRIHHAVAVQDHLARSTTAWSRWVGWATSLAVTVGLALLVVVYRPAALGTAVRTEPSSTAVESRSHDSDWELLLAIVDAGAAEDEATVTAPGSADALAADLSSEERAVLVRLLESEMKGTDGT